MTQNGRWPADGPTQPQQPYGEPADPWSGQAAPGWVDSEPTVPQAAAVPTVATSDFEPTAGVPVGGSVGGPVASGGRARRRVTPLVALVVGLAVLAAGGLGVASWLWWDRPTAPATVAGAVTVPSAAAAPTAARASTEARFVARGQCIRNEGTAEVPAMRVVPCTSGTYEVLRRIDGRTTGEADAEAKCSKVKRYTKWYLYDSELDSLDFVLCLRDR